MFIIGWNWLPTLTATEAFQETSHLLFYRPHRQTGEVKSPVPVEINLLFHEINPRKGVTLWVVQTSADGIWEVGKGWGWMRKSAIAQELTEGGPKVEATGQTCHMTYFTVRWTFLAELAE